MILKKLNKTAVATSLVFASIGCAMAATPILQMVSSLESNNSTTATNPASTSTGMYQDTQAALAQAGILKINSQPTPAQFGANGSWSNVTFLPNQWGITSRSQLLSAPASVQTQIEQAYLKSSWQQSQALGSTNFIGQTVNGQVINQSAIVGCSEFLGAQGCYNYLSTGNAGPNTAAAEQLISQYSQADSSSITGQQGLTVAQSQPSVSPGMENYAGLGVYCDLNTAKYLAGAAQRAVQAQVTLASNPYTGYSPIMSPTTFASNPALASGGFFQANCLSSLYQTGISSFFSSPVASFILSQVTNAACNQVSSLIDNEVNSLSSKILNGASAGTGFSPYTLSYLMGAANSMASSSGSLQQYISQNGLPAQGVDALSSSTGVNPYMASYIGQAGAALQSNNPQDIGGIPPLPISNDALSNFVGVTPTGGYATSTLFGGAF